MKHLHANTNASNNADEDGQEDVRGDVLGELAPGVVVLSEVTSVVSVMAVVAMLAVTALTVHAVLATAAVLATHVPQDGGAPLAVQGGAVSGSLLVLLGGGDGSLGHVDVGDHELAVGGLDQLDVDIGDVADEAVANLDDLKVNLEELELLVLVHRDGADGKAVAQLRSVGVGLTRVLCGSLGEGGNLRSAEGRVPGGGLGVQLEVVDEEVVEAGGVGFDGEGQLEVVLDVGHGVVAAIVVPHGKGGSQGSQA